MQDKRKSDKSTTGSDAGREESAAPMDRRSGEDRRTRDVGRPEGDRRKVTDRRTGNPGSRKAIGTYQTFSGQKNQEKQREELVKKHLNLVSYVVARMSMGLPSWIDKRDLVNAGVIGLIDAVNNFDPARGVKLETYASTRIRGAIIDELRSLDWIPRSTRNKSRDIENAVSGLITSLGRFPTDAEIADDLGWDLDKYHKALDEVSGTTLLSLDELIDPSGAGDQVRRIDTLADEEEGALKTMERQELLGNVVTILETLSEQERLTIALYYYEELTLKEIGMVMNVSESRVSQIHTAAIIKLRAKLRQMYA